MRYSLVYGGLAGAIVIAVTLIVFFSGVTDIGHGSMLFGYLVMLVALSMIFVGVKRYRDVECGGVIRFGRAFGLGLGMALVASLIYIVGWEIYLATTGWDFMTDYQGQMLADMQANGASAQEIAETRATMAVWGERYQSLLWRVPITFSEIFPVGLLVALVSAAILRNPRVLPAHSPRATV
jgi:hypothetical protein